MLNSCKTVSALLWLASLVLQPTQQNEIAHLLPRYVYVQECCFPKAARAWRNSVKLKVEFPLTLRTPPQGFPEQWAFCPGTLHSVLNSFQ